MGDPGTTGAVGVAASSDSNSGVTNPGEAANGKRAFGTPVIATRIAAPKVPVNATARLRLNHPRASAPPIGDDS